MCVGKLIFLSSIGSHIQAWMTWRYLPWKSSDDALDVDLQDENERFLRDDHQKSDI